MAGKVVWYSMGETISLSHFNDEEISTMKSGDKMVFKSFRDMAEAIRPELRAKGYSLPKRKKPNPSLNLSLTLGMDRVTQHIATKELRLKRGNRKINLSKNMSRYVSVTESGAVTLHGRSAINKVMGAMLVR